MTVESRKAQPASGHTVYWTGHVTEEQWRAEHERLWKLARDRGLTARYVNPDDPDSPEVELVLPGATITMGNGTTSLDLEGVISRHQSIGYLKGWL